VASVGGSLRGVTDVGWARLGRRYLDAWREHLTAHRVAIEREIHWEAELASIYVRDPAGNSVELANGELWE
jgi:hypothetical protein